MNRDKIKAVQAREGVHLVVKPDGSAKSIEPGVEPPEGCTIVAVKVPEDFRRGERTLERARHVLRLSLAAAKLTTHELEKLEDKDPTAAGELRRAARLVKVVKNG